MNHYLSSLPFINSSELIACNSSETVFPSVYYSNFWVFSYHGTLFSPDSHITSSERVHLSRGGKWFWSPWPRIPHQKTPCKGGKIDGFRWRFSQLNQSIEINITMEHWCHAHEWIKLENGHVPIKTGFYLKFHAHFHCKHGYNCGTMMINDVQNHGILIILAHFSNPSAVRNSAEICCAEDRTGSVLFEFRIIDLKQILRHHCNKNLAAYAHWIFIDPEWHINLQYNLQIYL